MLINTNYIRWQKDKKNSKNKKLFKLQKQRIESKKEYFKWRKKNKKRYISIMANNNEIDVFFYVIKFFSDNERFIKIGVSIDPDERIKSIPYEFKFLIKEPLRIDKACDIEETLIKKFYMEGLNKKPKKYFDGSTECFSTACLLSMKRTLINNNIFRL